MGAVESSIVHGKKPPEWKGDLAVYQSLVKFPERGDCASFVLAIFGASSPGLVLRTFYILLPNFPNLNFQMIFAAHIHISNGH